MVKRGIDVVEGREVGCLRAADFEILRPVGRTAPDHLAWDKKTLNVLQGKRGGKIEFPSKRSHSWGTKGGQLLMCFSPRGGQDE